MRALLIVNPHATSTNERRRDLLAHALAGEMSLRVAHTKSRGHAANLAAAAADSGVDVVVVHGGDGTVNEVVNGLMYRGIRPDTPLLGIVPGGSTNVFARALGIDSDPTLATEQILEALAAHRTTTVSLGRAGDRYFTFNAGLGLDAEAVHAVEDRRHAGQRDLQRHACPDDGAEVSAVRSPASPADPGAARPGPDHRTCIWCSSRMSIPGRTSATDRSGPTRARPFRPVSGYLP